MKYLFLFLFILILLPIISAQEIKIAEETYQPGETFQAEIFVSNLVRDIESKDIVLLKDNKEISLGFILTKLSDNYYYIYTNLPTYLGEGSYTLQISKILYKEKEVLKEILLSRNFNIKDLERNLFTIEPALLKYETGKPFFKIQINNLEDKAITLDISADETFIQPFVNKLIIPGNSIDYLNIYVDIDSIKKGAKANLNINHYKIPFWIYAGEVIITPQESPILFFVKQDDKENKLSYYTTEIEKETAFYDTIFIKNILNITLNNIKFSLTGNLNKIIELNTTEIDSLEPNQITSNYILINKNKDAELNEYSGDLSLTANSYTSRLPIKIIIKEVKKVECQTDEDCPQSKCIGAKPQCIDGVCIMPRCGIIAENQTEPIPEVEKKSKSWYFSLIIILVLLIIIYFVTRKKTKPEKFSEYIKKLEKK